MLFHRSRSFLAVVAVLGLLAIAGCTKKSVKAVVIEKRYVPAHVEGTEYKEGEMSHEQWLVTVEMENGRKNNAPVTEAQWNSLKVGDAVVAKYSQGNYTGTIWGIDLEKK